MVHCFSYQIQGLGIPAVLSPLQWHLLHVILYLSFSMFVCFLKSHSFFYMPKIYKWLRLGTYETSNTIQDHGEVTVRCRSGIEVESWNVCNVATKPGFTYWYTTELGAPLYMPSLMQRTMQIYNLMQVLMHYFFIVVAELRNVIVAVA